MWTLEKKVGLEGGGRGKMGESGSGGKHLRRKRGLENENRKSQNVVPRKR